MLRTRLGTLDTNGELLGEIAKSSAQFPNHSGEHFPKAAMIASLAKYILETTHTTRELRDAYEFSASNIRNMCLNLGWMLEVMSGIAQVAKPTFHRQITIMAECIRRRCPIAARGLNTIHTILNRDEKLKLIGAGYKEEDDFLDRKGGDFKGIIYPSKANKIIEEINQKRTKNHEYWAREHKRRLDAIGVNVDEVEALYVAAGTKLECAIRELFDTRFADCSVIRITDQKKAEPDLLMTLPSGRKMTIQVTASENQTKYIDSKKAGDVIPQSARFHPDGYMCIGRPDFQALAIEQADHLGLDQNFKLIPISVLAEMFVRRKEGKISSAKCAKLLYSSRGYVTISEIDKATKAER